MRLRLELSRALVERAGDRLPGGRGAICATYTAAGAPPQGTRLLSAGARPALEGRVSSRFHLNPDKASGAYAAQLAQRNRAVEEAEEATRCVRACVVVCEGCGGRGGVGGGRRRRLNAAALRRQRVAVVDMDEPRMAPNRRPLVMPKRERKPEVQRAGRGSVCVGGGRSWRFPVPCEMLADASPTATTRPYCFAGSTRRLRCARTGRRWTSRIVSACPRYEMRVGPGAVLALCGPGVCARCGVRGCASYCWHGRDGRGARAHARRRQSTSYWSRIAST